MSTSRPRPTNAKTAATAWSRDLAAAVRDPAELLRRLDLTESLLPGAEAAARTFPVMVPESFLARMRPGDADDPLLRQVLPVGEELEDVDGFTADAVADLDHRPAAGLIQKYEGRVLLIAAGSCAVNCRYCFRRHYPYGDEPRTLAQWQPTLDHITDDPSVREVILSGGDPLMLTDSRFSELVGRIADISHVRRLRVHSRLPIVLPSRVTDRLIATLTQSRLQPWFVVHANHPHEIEADCVESLQRLVRSGIPVLNQAVLLRGINDSADALIGLCERLIDVGVRPYYVNQLDRVAGAAHFEVSDRKARILMQSLRRRLPGYAVPVLVRDCVEGLSKTPV